MFGKDTAHCDSSGFVTELLDQQITRVALGKAHCVALNTKGQLFTFGLNNKGQCGRLKGKEGGTATGSTIANAASSSASAAATIMETSEQPNTIAADSGGRFKYDASNICDFEEHQVDQGQCRVNALFLDWATNVCACVCLGLCFLS